MSRFQMHRTPISWGPVSQVFVNLTVPPTTQWKRIDFESRSVPPISFSAFDRFLAAERQDMEQYLEGWKIRLLELSVQMTTTGLTEEEQQELQRLLVRYQEDLTEEAGVRQPARPALTIVGSFRNSMPASLAKNGASGASATASTWHSGCIASTSRAMFRVLRR